MNINFNILYFNEKFIKYIMNINFLLNSNQEK